MYHLSSFKWFFQLVQRVMPGHMAKSTHKSVFVARKKFRKHRKHSSQHGMLFRVIYLVYMQKFFFSVGHILLREGMSIEVGHRETDMGFDFRIFH